jgi:hypothetical protein
VGESSPINKERAREHILSTVAHSTAPSDISRHRQFIFAVAQAALITVGVLVLMVGAAAAAGVDLSSVPRHVVDTLAEPLPLAAQGLKNSGALKPGEGEPRSASTRSGNEVSPSVEGPAVQGQSFTLVSGSPKTASRETNTPVHGGTASQTNPAANNPRHASPPQTDPAGRGLQSPANDPLGGRNGQEHQSTQPDTTGPPGNTQRHDGQPAGSEQSASNQANTQDGSDQQEQNDSTDNGANGGDSDNRSTRELGNGSSSSESDAQNTGDSGESNSGAGPAGTGGTK